MQNNLTSLQKIPYYILISNKTQNHVQFDDQNLLMTADYKIAGLRVGTYQNKICGITFQYQKLDGSDKVQFGYDNQIQTSFIKYDEFLIDNDDFIQVLYGCYYNGVTQLGIITYKGKQVEFGNYGGQQFKYLFMGFTFTAAYGVYHPQGIFKSLGFRIAKLPQQYLQQFFSPLAELVYPNSNHEEPNQQQYNGVQEENSHLLNQNNDQQNYEQQNQRTETINLQGQQKLSLNTMIIQTEIKKEKRQQIQQQQQYQQNNRIIYMDIFFLLCCILSLRK